MSQFTVGLRDARFRGPHGVHASEAVLGGEFRVDVTCVLRKRDAPVNEDLAATLDYSALYAICAEVMAVRADLLETLAERMVGRIQAEFGSLVEHVVLEVQKVHPPVGGRVGAAWVRLEVPLLARISGLGKTGGAVEMSSSRGRPPLPPSGE